MKDHVKEHSEQEVLDGGPSSYILVPAKENNVTPYKA